VVPGDSKTVEEKYLGDLPFDFDENDGDFEFPLKKNEVLVSEMQEEPESEPETESVTSHDTSGGVALSAYSQSPARHILSRSAQARSQPESDAPISRSKKVNVWHGIFPDPVIDPEILKEVEKMGNVHSFVGSIHDRTGFEEADIQSFKESFRGGGSFRGEPKSLTERMIMEELLERDEGNEKLKSVTQVKGTVGEKGGGKGRATKRGEHKGKDKESA
jgi:hypothetical protein